MLNAGEGVGIGSEGEIDPAEERVPLLNNEARQDCEEEKLRHNEEGGDPDQSPVEEVALTVPTTDDPTLPVWTFRVWTLGLTSCVVISFLNMFFNYRTEPLILTSVSAQIATLPIGHLMAGTLPRSVRVPFLRGRRGLDIVLNPGPFNVKEHVLISVFGSAGAAFGSGEVFAVNTVNAIKAFYHRNISFLACFILVISSHVLGYGWAGLLRRYVVDPAQMWWPSQLMQVSLFRALHEKESGKGLTRSQFFVLAMTASFAYYLLPGYLFKVVTCISWVCWLWPNSVTAHQLGSGMKGLGIGAVSLDWAGMAAFLGSPLVSPWMATVNVAAGTVVCLYIIMPIAYWGNVYDARTFPIFSSGLFQANGQKYDVNSIVGDDFKLDVAAYEKYGQVNISLIFALTYGFGFATMSSTLTNVLLFHGKEIWQQSRAAIETRTVDVHTRLMRMYPDIPRWWFILALVTSVTLAMMVCELHKAELQLPWWGILLSVALSSVLTLPIAVLTATANKTPGLNIISEYIIGLILPGQPIANMCFKTYSYSGTKQAISFLADFKLGHYMKIPPRSMFAAQVVGALLNATVNLLTAWWMLSTVPNICDLDLLPAGSPWTCPYGRVFYDASVIWGLVGPARIFGSEGIYRKLNWWFLGGALMPVPVWLLSRRYPKSKWISMINVPIFIAAASEVPPATSLNLGAWVIVGTIFNYFIFNYRKRWWQRYNYILSAALDAGTAFMAVALYFALELEGRSLDWWGNQPDQCPLAHCPTAPGVVVEGCPVF
ncbi:unnamed protein product [Calypogeia fissa]